ncbi:CaiB/BaiF CoA transferase family protein [Natrinema gelatinilyticum]|uniref:CaiB/BaiF CoA transferase family protein n=1 Tax=Natrinema gelatinilyticum TaxID=2961571 RepID=UPI0020C56668|nr:CoA transferase [Natrinema gelatinilyticum]
MQPLQDIDVLDLTQSIAGPLCTQMLGEMGAEVIKVEPPGGDAFRSLMNGNFFTAYNNGKKSICVDLKTDEGRELLTDLAAKADVLVESFRPGVLAEYGLDYETVSKENEGIVYCSLSGFGQTGPYHDYPGYDPVIQAISGLMATTGYPDQPPVRIRSSLIDCGTGTNAAFAVMAAIRERDKTGEGDYIDVSLFDVGISWMSYWIANYNTTGKIPERNGQKGIGSAPNGLFEASDGYVYMITMTQAMFERVCEAVDRPDLIDDEKYLTMDDRIENRSELRKELQEAFASFTAQELETLLLESRVPAAAVRTIDEVVELPHLKARSMLTESYNPEADEPVDVASLPFTFGSDGDRPGYSTPPPEKGEHTAEVLEQFEYSGNQIETLRSNGAIE